VCCGTATGIVKEPPHRRDGGSKLKRRVCEVPTVPDGGFEQKVLAIEDKGRLGITERQDAVDGGGIMPVSHSLYDGAIGPPECGYDRVPSASEPFSRSTIDQLHRCLGK